MARPDGGVIDALVEAVATAVSPHEPSTVVVALGGGADSACLVVAAERAVERPVRAVFVDHGLAQSSDLRGAAAAVAGAAGVPFDAIAAPVLDGPHLEARARTARYAAIEASLEPGAVALTAHTRDDQAETILMRLAAGAGATGLSGIPAERGAWLRPFLRFGRAELRAEADRLALPYADDPANDDDRFERSRVRHRVMPVVRSELGDTADAGLARAAGILARDDAALGALADDIPVAIHPDGARVPVGSIVTAHPAVAARALRRALRAVGDGYPGTSADVEAVLDTASTATTRSLTGGWMAVHEGATVHIGRPLEPPAPVHLGCGASVTWAGSRYSLIGDDPRPVLRGGRFTVLASAAVADGVTIRGARDGDRLDIGAGTTPVAEVLRAAGVAASARPVSPVAVVGAKIAAVIGVRTAAWASPGPDEPRAIIERGVAS